MATEKVLLVQNDDALRLDGERALIAAGYQVRSVSDGQGALRAVQESVPELILLDLSLADSSGLAALKMLKGDLATTHIPLILVNGQSISKLLDNDGFHGLSESRLHSEENAAGLLNAMNEIANTIQEDSAAKMDAKKASGAA